MNARIILVRWFLLLVVPWLLPRTVDAGDESPLCTQERDESPSPAVEDSAQRTAPPASDALTVPGTSAEAASQSESPSEAAKLKDHVPEALAGDLGSFALHLRFTPGQSGEVGKYKNLVLSVPDFNRTWNPDYWVSARITKDDASRIVKHLAAKGFFARCGTVRPFERKILPSPRGPGYTLTIGSAQWGFSVENLGCDQQTLRRLSALRAELRGDVAKAMDKLLSELEPYRKTWKKASADSDAVKARAAEVEKQIQAYYAALRGGERPARETWWEGNKEIMPLLVPHLLASSDPDVQHTALLIVRDHCGRRDFVPHIIGALDSLMNRPKDTMDHAGATRRLACKLLAEWPDLRSVPVLLRALGDPYVRHDLAVGPDGHGEHNYFAVWWEADRALRLITWANPIDEPRRGLVEGDDQDRTRAAWQRWWRANGDRLLKNSTPPWEKGDRTEAEWQLARLNHVEPHVRAEAAKALGQLGGDRAVRALIEAMGDERHGAPAVAVQALANIGPPAVGPLLEAMKDARPSVRRWTAEALGELHDPRGLDPLAAAMDDADEHVRDRAAFALTKLGRPGAERLLAALGDDSPQVRKEAAGTLYVLKGPAMVDPLIAAMKDKDSGVRGAAAYSLVRMGEKRAIEPLIEVVDDDEIWVRRYAVEGLATFGDSRAVEPLIAALADEDRKVRIEAAKGLGRLGDRRAADALIRALEDSDSEVRQLAATALGALEAPRAVEPLIGTLKDEHAAVRCASAAALGKLGDSLAVEPLKALLQDERDYVRRAAGDALKQIAKPKPAPEPASLKQTRSPKLLPGSSSTVAALAPSTTRAVVAVAESEARIASRSPMTFSGGMDMGGGEWVMGGGSSTLVLCRQTFSISEVFVGDISTGKVELSYSFYERYERVPGPSYKEMAIPIKARVILLLDADRRIPKAMPDTPENRKSVKTSLEDRQTSPEAKTPSRLLYYRWGGTSPGAGFSVTSLSAFELDLENRRVRKLQKHARRPQPMLPYEEKQIMALVEREEWEPLSKEDYGSIKSAVSAWLRTRPPEVYSRLGILGHEDGHAESIITFFGDAKRTTRIDLSPGRPNDPTRPPAQCEALIEAVLPRPTGLQQAVR